MIVPQLGQSKERLAFLKMATQLLIVKQVTSKSINAFLEQLITLLSKNDLNMQIFRKSLGFEQLILTDLF